MFFDEMDFGPYEKGELKALRAFELYEEGQMPQALAELDQAIETNPANSSWYFDKALTLDSMGKFEEAINEYEAALELNPSDLEILNSLAVDYTRTGQYDLAISTFEHVQQLDPNFEPCYCNRIITYTEMDLHDLAEQMFYLAQQIEPDCALCYYNIGNNLFVRGQYAKAAGCWQKTAELEPTHPQINYRIAQAYWSDGNIGQAREYFLTELRNDPGNVDVILDFGLLLLEEADIESAKEKFNRILELRPDFAPAMFYLGEIAFSNADYERAIKLFEQAIEKDVILLGPQYRLAQCALMTGQLQQARNYLISETQLSPQTPAVWLSIGSMFLAIAQAQNRSEKSEISTQKHNCADIDLNYAIKCFEKALQFEPANADACYYLGLTNVLKTQYEDAARFFAHALDLRPKDINTLRDSAITYLSMGKLTKAAERVDRALALSPDDPELKSLYRSITLAQARQRISELFSRLFFRLNLR